MAYVDSGGAGRAGSAVTRRLSGAGGAAGSSVRKSASVNNSPRRTSQRRNTGGGGGGYQRSYSSPSVSSTSSGRYSTPAPPPAARAGGGAIPSIKNFLGHDTGYLQGNRQLAKSLADFLADVGRRRSQLTSEFGLSQKAMNDQKGLDLDNLEEDYGARGLLRSGLYGDAVSKYNTEFNNRMTDLQRQQTNALTGLNAETSQFRGQQNLSRQSLREAAIRRRAEQYGL